MSSRALDQSEITKLLKQAKPEKESPDKWPGEVNLKLIAEAVDNRRQFVDLNPNSPDSRRFTIKYDERHKAVFVRPASNGKNITSGISSFTPCGWIEYKTLKEALVEE